MQQSRRLLFGPDPLAELNIDMRHYRGQLERELKVRLQLLRRRYVACSGNEVRIAQLMVASVSTFLVLLRAVLRLYNEPVPAEKADALAPLAKHVKFDPQPIREVLEIKTQRGSADSWRDRQAVWPVSGVDRSSRPRRRSVFASVTNQRHTFAREFS